MGIKRGRTGVHKHAVTAVVIRLAIIEVPFTKPGVLSWFVLNTENNKQGKVLKKINYSLNILTSLTLHKTLDKLVKEYCRLETRAWGETNK